MAIVRGRLPSTCTTPDAIVNEQTHTAAKVVAHINAANEVAVQLFLEERIRFLDIPRLIEQTLQLADTSAADLEALKAADQAARLRVKELQGIAIH